MGGSAGLHRIFPLLDLKAKLHFTLVFILGKFCSRLERSNLVLVCILLTLNYSPSGEHYVVKRQVEDVDYEVVGPYRSEAAQIYHINLLKAWREVVPLSLVSLASERDELEPSVPNTTNPLILLYDSHLSPSQRGVWWMAGSLAKVGQCMVWFGSVSGRDVIKQHRRHHQ